MRILPVCFIWRKVDVIHDDGEVTRAKAMVPLPRYANVCARQYADGEEYPLVPLEARSRASHNHFFAALSDGFDNLPENIAARWPTIDHMRCWMLIENGWFDEKDFDCPDEKFARRLAAFIRTEDEYARISVHRPADKADRWKVIVRRAKSQSAASMNKKDFEDSKRSVLDLLESMVGVKPGTLDREAGRNAS